MNPAAPVHVVGGGLAGSECAFQLATRGVPVVLHEMRPAEPTPAHATDRFAELVCSNSLRSDDPEHPAGILKREMEAFGSLVIGAARAHAVPAGSALAVDRDRFAEAITARLSSLPLLEVARGEVTALPPGDVVVATGEWFGNSLETGRHLRFSPRLTEGRLLATKYGAHAMIDVSDGLVRDLGHICEASGVGAHIFPDAIPCRDLEAALYDGEDYELLAALSPAQARRAAGLVRVIGMFVNGRGVLM
ncbi:MAG: FAD-dependent oxidoreductase, partial [Myxococcota bacterium]